MDQKLVQTNKQAASRIVVLEYAPSAGSKLI